MPTVTRFGNFFRQRRQILGLSLREFCRRNGFDPGNTSRLERGLFSPPHSAEVLESYAKALKLEPRSQEWHTFFDLAAAETGRIPHQMADNQVVLDKLPKTFRAWRDQRTRYGAWTRATDLELWADYLDARAQLPRLVRRLIHATLDSIESIESPAGEGVQRPGWDGIVATASGNAFIPSGLNVWEIGVDRDPGKKAEKEFQKRTKNPLGLDPSQTCFVFVTPRKWTKKSEWRDKKRKLGIWKDIRVYDSTNLEEWLETAPAVDAWIARLLGRRPDGVIDVEEHWVNLSSLTEPRLKPEVFLTSREKEVEILKKWLKGPPSSIAFEAPSPTEVIDFLAAYTASRKDSERDQIESRIVIVEDKEAWHVLCPAKNSLLLIPRPNLSIDAEMVAEAVRQGHHVLLCSHRFASNRTTKQELSRPYRYDLEKALVSSGVSEEKASQLAREAGGSLTVLKRRLSHFPSTWQPAWSQSRNAPDLVPILLAGEWDDANAGDRAILAKLAGRSYDEVLSTVHRWIANEDPPLIRLFTCWSLVSREDSWTLLAPHVTRYQLEIFEEVAVEVLGEDDPRYDLSPNQRWYAGLHDKLPKYSGQLRTGIAETLALLGTEPYSRLIQAPGEPARRAENVVQRLLKDDLPWKRWASLGSLLPVLAEASPEALLNAVEAELRSKESQLPKLFADKGEPPFSSCTHAGLLWALETLAWEPSLLTRVSLALARLERIAPKEGQWANRPITSLRAIFLPWLPQTTASVERRIEVLKVLARKVPDIGWHLLLDLLPTFHGTSSFTRRPRWRDWALNWSQRVTNAEYWKQVEGCAGLLVDLVGTDTERWVQLIENFENFPLPAQERLICRLRDLDLGTLSSIARKRVTDELRKKIHRHRSFQDAHWALPTEKLDELEALKERFEPQDLIAQHAWLFNMHPELVSDHNAPWQQREEKLFQLRRDALREILDHGGLQRVFELVEAAEDPHTIGVVLGKARLLEKDSPILPSLLTSENQKIADFAIGYGQGRFADAGWEWIDHIGLSQWTPEQAGRFLAFVPYFERKTRELVTQLGASILKEYWGQMPGLYRNVSTEDVEFAVSMLLKYNRPFKAVEVLGMALHEKHDVGSSLLIDTLETGLKLREQRRSEGDTPNHVSYEIQQLFERLQSDPNVDIQRLAALEWGYLGLLDGHGASPETLFRLLQTEPRFFADLLCLVFRSDQEPDESIETPTEQQKARAQNAYRLLKKWASVPGLQEDNTTVDEQELLEWVTEARRLCEERGRLVVCDLRIGEVLAHAPEETDGTWPCVPVRDVIDEIDSENLVRGFEIGIFNRRGVFIKSPIEGGAQERELAQKYTSYAEACDIEWPVTAAALRRVAHQYEDDARREDEDAKERFLR